LLNNVTLKTYSTSPGLGLKTTLAAMKDLENTSLKNPEFVSWIHSTFNNDCVSCFPGDLWKYVLNNFQFVNDAPYDEVLIAPYQMRFIQKGDCDDFALFIKTALDILGGWKTYFVILGAAPGVYTHVAVYAIRTFTGSDSVYIDATSKSFNVLPGKYKFYSLVK
jgi:hypothetical protein